MEWSLTFFFFIKFACWEICMKYSFGFKSHCQIATVWEGDTLRTQWIEGVRKQTRIFSRSSDMVSDYLLLPAIIRTGFE